MRNMKYAAKKMAALIMAGAMAATPVVSTVNLTALTAMAAQPKSTDAGTVTINNVEAGSTVKLYKLVQANFNSNGDYDGWEATTAAGTNVAEANKSATDTTKVWKANVEALLTSINANTNGVWVESGEGQNVFTMAANENTNTTYEATVAPGMYLALVTPPGTDDDAYIYNPMLVSVSYTSDGTGGYNISSTPLSADSNFDVDYNSANGATAWAKKTPVSLTKKITNPDDVSGANTIAGSDGDDLQVGDSQEFTLTTTIPDYRGYTNLNATQLVFKLEDNRQDSFSQPTSITVKVGGSVTAESTESAKTYTITYGNYSAAPDDATDAYGTWNAGTTGAQADEDFQISFDRAFLLAHPGESVTVVYKSTLLNASYQGTTANDNDVKLTYTNKNKTSENTGTKHDHTYDYTFPLKVKKVDGTNTTVGLAGAKFKITRQSATVLDADAGTYTLSDVTAVTGDKPAVQNEELETTTNGQNTVTFTGLDEGFYKIEETKQPDGYSLNTEKFYIHIDPTYDTDGKLTSYTVSQVKSDGTKLTGDDTTTAAFTANTGSTGVTDAALLTVKDTKVTGLPSTGARSALILTICGAAVMITVMVASKRKKIED